MDTFLEGLRQAARKVMRAVAKGLNRLTSGKLHPNVITIVGLVAHLPIAYLVAVGRLGWAAVFLVIFGLFDTLDGELARLQNRATTRGMFLDSVTDRLKEVILYIGAAYLFVVNDQPGYAIWSLAAIGFAVTVSYVNAWGEVAISKQAGVGHQANKTFRNGLLTYDVRIALFIVGLAFDVLDYAIVVIAVLSFVTILQRTSRVLKKLS